MKLTNTMEQAVKAHLARIREQFAGDDEICWCPLCRADTMALALSSLPPRYLTRRAAANEVEAIPGNVVREEVLRALRHIGSRPKHEPGSAVPADEPVWVVNFPLEEGFRAVDEYLRRRGDLCDCWDCRCDAVAFALNRYPARYGVEYRGKTHLLDGARAEMREELSGFLGLGISIASTIPRHEAVGVR